jgi:hypothetical protein
MSIIAAGGQTSAMGCLRARVVEEPLHEGRVDPPQLARD